MSFFFLSQVFGLTLKKATNFRKNKKKKGKISAFPIFSFLLSLSAFLFLWRGVYYYMNFFFQLPFSPLLPLPPLSPSRPCSLSSSTSDFSSRPFDFLLFFILTIAIYTHRWHPRENVLECRLGTCKSFSSIYKYIYVYKFDKKKAAKICSENKRVRKPRGGGNYIRIYPKQTKKKKRKIKIGAIKSMESLKTHEISALRVFPTSTREHINQKNTNRPRSQKSNKHIN